MSTFCGNLNDRYARISLDRFDADNLNSTVFWLSHAHADHMVGLSSTQFYKHIKSNPTIKLYSTDITKRLVSCMKCYSHVAEYMHVLAIDEPTMVDIPWTDGGPQAEVEQVTLTAIPAGHCPGSAMLLVEGTEGTVLYTGDFRFDVGTARMLNSLHDGYGSPKEIDALHCDTTFLTQRALNLASRTECEEAIVKEIRDHISKGKNYHILLRVKAKLGYENVYKVIYDTLGVRTHIQSNDAFLYSHIGSILETVTSNAESQVHACCRYIITDDSTFRPSQPDSKCDVLLRPGIITKVIHLSTLWFVHTEERHMSVRTASDTVRCCYSFHSSYAEIADFIRYLKPKTVHANVVAIRQSMQKTEDMLNELLLSEEGDPHAPAIQQPELWKSITDVDVWWKGKRKASADITAATVAKIARPAADQPCSGSSTASRETTPELDLWSDEESNHEGEQAAEPVEPCSRLLGDKEIACCDSEDEDMTIAPVCT